MLLTDLRFSVIVGQQSSKSVTYFDRSISIFWGVPDDDAIELVRLGSYSELGLA